MAILLIVLMTLVVLLIARAHHTVRSLPPPSVGDPALDRDRQRVMDDLRWRAAAEPGRPAGGRRHRRASEEVARR